MSPRLKKILKALGYPVFYLAVFSIFLIVTFPYDRLKERGSWSSTRASPLATAPDSASTT